MYLKRQLKFIKVYNTYFIIFYMTTHQKEYLDKRIYNIISILRYYFTKLLISTNIK